ncbi:MAG TPA: GTP-binding protein [Fibrobacteraceae bacterium]|nr:GTP-binding protein [Fibrobacteraceae bacterium]
MNAQETRHPVHVVTVAGPPSSGKTSVILRAIQTRENQGASCGVVKFDCLNSLDTARYQEQGIPVLAGVAGNICPDHYFVTNVESCLDWAVQSHLDLLVIESAGLCNRCSPHLKESLAVCVLDCLSGIDTPLKVGPMLKLADMVILTKGDMISQAEREVYRYRVRKVNPKAEVRFVNGISGQGCHRLFESWMDSEPVLTLQGARLRFTMPTAVCSYCLGETRVGKERQIGIVKTLGT